MIVPLTRAKSWVSCLLVALACARPRALPAQDGRAADQVTVLILADVRGYIGPCGCSEGMRGGIAKAATVVGDARREGVPVLLLDGGDTLFGAPALDARRAPQEIEKARTLASALRSMELAARASGELDRPQGVDASVVPTLPTMEMGTPRVLQLAGRKVAAAVGNSPAEVDKAARSARAQGAELVVGFVHQSLAELLGKTQDVAVDLLVPTHGQSESDGEESRLVPGPPPLARIQSKGRSLLRLDVRFGGGGAFTLLRTSAETTRELAALDERIAQLKRQVNEPSITPQLKKLKQGKLDETIARREAKAAEQPPSPDGLNALTARFVPIEASIPDHPDVAKLVAAYDARVAELNVAWAKAHGEDCPKPKKREAAFVGSQACKECHAETFPSWESSKHAVAYKTLEERNKQFHLDCIGCHVVGANKPGGVCRVDKVEGRKEVGCESCHGPGSLHLDEPTAANVIASPKEADCVGCHDRENSPHFDWAAYLPKILGPGHGR